MRRTSLGVRLGAFAVALVLLSLALSTAIVYRRTTAALERSLAAELLAIVQSTAPLIDGDLHQLVTRGADGVIAAHEELELLRTILVQVRNANGLVNPHGGSPLYTMRRAGDFATTGELEFVVMSDPSPTTGTYFTGNRYQPQPLDLMALAGTGVTSGLYTDAEGTWISAAAPIRDGSGEVVAILQADRPVDFFFAAARREALALVAGAGVVLLLALPFATWLARSVARPIQALTAAAERVGEGELAGRVDECRRDELGDLGRQFNVMVSQLHDVRQAMASQMTELEAARDLAESNEQAARLLGVERARMGDLKSRLFSQVSHQFRTPLTIVLSAAQALQRYSDRLTTEDRDKRIERIVGAVHHLEELLDAVLTFDRPLDGTTDCLKEHVDVAALGHQVLDEVRATVETTRVLTWRSQSESTMGQVDPLLMRRIIKNLVSNAVKYSPADSPVEVALACDERGVELSVSDHGPGIAAEDRASLFQPFCRGANSDCVEGFGLGLAITQRAVTAQGGTIAVDSTPGRGATFTVRLPAG